MDSIVPNIFEILILSIFIKHLYYIQEIIPDYVVSINHKETVEEDVPILDYFDDGLLKKGNWEGVIIDSIKNYIGEDSENVVIVIKLIETIIENF